MLHLLNKISIQLTNRTYDNSRSYFCGTRRKSGTQSLHWSFERILNCILIQDSIVSKMNPNKSRKNRSLKVAMLKHNIISVSLCVRDLIRCERTLIFKFYSDKSRNAKFQYLLKCRKYLIRQQTDKNEENQTEGNSKMDRGNGKVGRNGLESLGLMGASKIKNVF